MSRYRVSRRAIRDLDDIWLALARENESAAETLLQRMEALFRTLASQPRMGRARPEILPPIRSTSLEHYVVFYRPVHPEFGS